MPYTASAELAARVLEGNARAIARLISRAESGIDEVRPALETMFTNAGHAHIVGITGVPGSGKSTLVAKLARAVRASGRKVGIVAIDPSSPFSGGSILGDRIRMGELAGDSGVFVRSMATRGALGGLAPGTLEAVDILDAGGYETIMIETVGVGQDEVEVARAAHTTVVVSAPGLGDDIQAIKAGILEIADVHVVSKCDRPDANKTIADLKSMLALGATLAGSSAGWHPPVVATSGLNGEGVSDVVAQIDRHHRALAATGEMEKRCAQIAERRILRAAEAIMRTRFEQRHDDRLQGLIDATCRRVISPHAAALRLLNELRIGGDS